MLLAPGNQGGQPLVRVEYGVAKLTPELGLMLAGRTDRPWRLGVGHWTSLETNCPLSFAGVGGGSATVPPGRYLMTLKAVVREDPVRQSSPQDRRSVSWLLCLLDPDTVRRSQWTADRAGDTRGGIQIPVLHRDLSTLAAQPRYQELAIHFVPFRRRTEQGGSTAQMRILFGTEEFRVGFGLEPRVPRAYVPDAGTKLTEAERAVFADPDEVTLFTLETEPLPAREAMLSSKILLHRYPVIDSRVLQEPAEQAQVLGWTMGSIVGDGGDMARCFMPRHGILVKRGDTEVSILLCFQCRQRVIHGPDGSRSGQLADQDRDAMNAFCKAHGLRVAE